MQKKMYEVYVESAGGIKHTIDQFETVEKAIAFCEDHGWTWVDENHFEWSLDYREVKAMARQEMINKLMTMARELAKNYSWNRYMALFDMCCDWNRDHEESEEIFVCEIYKADGYENDGIIVEDDYFCYAQ